MRVAYVCADPGVPVFGTKGASVHVQEVLRAFRRRGDDIELFTPRPGGRPPTGLTGVGVHAVPALGRGPTAERERRAQAADAGLRAALAAGPAPDLVYERYSLWSTAGTTFARAAGVPSVLEVNAPLVEEQARHRDLVDRAGAEQVARRAFAVATAVVAVSAEVAGWVREVCPTARVSVVPNGVDPHRFPVAPRPAAGVGHGEGDEAFTVGFVGSLKPWHGVDRLVRAVARLAATEPGWRLLLVGDGPERARLAAAVEAAGLADAVTFTGAVPAEAVGDLLAGVDVAAAPYPEAEGCYFSPLKVFEYLAAGLPVVASRVGQIPDVVADGRTGVLVPPGDVAALADALAGLRRDPARRAALGAAGRASVVAHHTWDAVVARIVDLATAAHDARKAA